jgi:hypothetical protein
MIKKKEEFFWSVHAMRQSQKKYFATRSPDALKKAKKAEKIVDDYLEYYLDGLMGLPQQGD